MSFINILQDDLGTIIRNEIYKTMLDYPHSNGNTAFRNIIGIRFNVIEQSDCRLIIIIPGAVGEGIIDARIRNGEIKGSFYIFIFLGIDTLYLSFSNAISQENRPTPLPPIWDLYVESDSINEAIFASLNPIPLSIISKD